LPFRAIDIGCSALGTFTERLTVAVCSVILISIFLLDTERGSDLLQ